MLGERIKLRRKELNMKQSVWAEKLDISNNHLCSIENGKQIPSLELFANICVELDVTPDYLLLGSIHDHNVPKNIVDMLLLCSPQDLELVTTITKFLVTRNQNEHTRNNY